MKTLYILTLSFFLLLTQGCSTAHTNGKLVISPLKNHQIKRELNKQYTTWKGSLYKMGGLKRSGVDCSGFIYRVFKDGVGVNLPRTTAQQSKLGHFINKRKLKVGDLVFFKTGSILKSRHVGIYTGSNQFIHASTSKGVIKSSLNNPYWKEAYWHSRRVLK